MNVEVLPEVIDYFKVLKPAAIQQRNGRYQPDNTEECGCCVGAHLAFLLYISKGGERQMGTGYIYGYQELAKRLEISSNTLDIHLRNHGAPASPWGVNQWQTHPADVFIRLYESEKDS